MNEHLLLVEDDASIREITTLGPRAGGFQGDRQRRRARRAAAISAGVIRPGRPRRDASLVGWPRGLPRDPARQPDPHRHAYRAHRPARRRRRARARRRRLRHEAVRAARARGADQGRAPTLGRSTRGPGDRRRRPRDRSGGVHRQRGGEEVALTATEFRLLLELARRPGQVFTRELLLELVWNYDYLGDSRLVDAAVQRLRAKIEDDPKQPRLIHTVRGVGYRFDVG